MVCDGRECLHGSARVSADVGHPLRANGRRVSKYINMKTIETLERDTMIGTLEWALSTLAQHELSELDQAMLARSIKWLQFVKENVQP